MSGFCGIQGNIMRFSFWPAPSQPYTDVLELAQHVEKTGWDGLWYADHFMPNAEDTSAPHQEAWTTLSAIGAVVPRIRIGTLVIGNTYRHPAVLAKMAATLDHITNGRVVLGMGSGWQENEHIAYGIPFYTVAERLRRLDEACHVIRSLFTHASSDFDGEYYQLKQAALEPKPVQKPLPLLIGGGGEKVTLKITAKYADEWNVWGDVTRLREKMAILDAHCADIDRNPAEIKRTAVALLFMSEDKAYLEKMRAANIQQPAIIGTPAEVKDIVAQYQAIGVDELIVPDFTLGPREQKLETLDTFITRVAGR
jgi:F420-dependent oxidoreductase-like protein